MIDQFAKHPWPVDAAYFFYVVVTDERVSNDVERLQARFDFPELVPVLSDELHITVLPIGFENKVADAQLQGLATDASSAVSAVARESITLGPVVVDDDQVVLLARPCEGLCSVRETLQKIVQKHLGDDAMTATEHFRPHLSMFYSSGDHPSEPVEHVAVAVNSTDQLGETTLVIGELSLVKVTRAHGHYRNTVIHSFQFRNAARTIT